MTTTEDAPVVDLPDEVAVTMQGAPVSKLSGNCTISVTFCRPLPSSL